jgi:methionine salvage enolase-phosphatase E1
LVQGFQRRRFKCESLRRTTFLRNYWTNMNQNSTNLILKPSFALIDNWQFIKHLFGLIWFRGFRGEDLNVKVYDVRQVMTKAHLALAKK